MPQSRQRTPMLGKAGPIDDVPMDVVVDKRNRALSQGDQSAELSRLRQSEATLIEQLEAKEFVMQELLQKLATANDELKAAKMTGRGAGGGGQSAAPASTPARPASGASPSTVAARGSGLSYDSLVEKLEQMVLDGKKAEVKGDEDDGGGVWDDEGFYDRPWH